MTRILRPYVDNDQLVQCLGLMTGAQWHARPVPDAPDVRVVREQVRSTRDGYLRHMARVAKALEIAHDGPRLHALHACAVAQGFDRTGFLRRAYEAQASGTVFSVWLMYIGAVAYADTATSGDYAAERRERMIAELCAYKG